MTFKELSRLSKEIETPAYVFSGEEFKARASAATNILGRDVGICYSIKANPFLLAMLPDDFSAVEVCSPGELSICMEMKIDPAMIIYSGLNKGTEDIGRALDYGTGLITAESLTHLDMINKCAAERGITANVLVRASANSQFGIDRKSLPGILSEHDKYPAISFSGLHFFTGTQKHKAKEIIKELSFLERYIEELRTVSGLELPRIEYGTGLPAYMFGDKDIQSEGDAFGAELSMLEEIAPQLKELAKVSSLTIEMGRFFAASCGHYFTKVVDVKRNDDVNYAIIDGGSHQIRYFGQMQGMQIPFIDLVKTDAQCEPSHQTDSSDEHWTICGSLCTTADVLARNVSFKGEKLEIGDILIFHQAGAYALYECMSLFLSRDLPGIYLLNTNGKLYHARGRRDSYKLNMPEVDLFK